MIDDDAILRAAANLGVLGGRATAAQTLRLLTNPSVSVADVAASIDQEPTLAARVLRVANSAYYGVQREISTVESAAVMLGLDVLRAIAAAACFDSALMQSKDLKTASVDDLRRHCLGAAVAAETIAKLVDRKLAPVAFMGGLLHDLGILVKLGLEVTNQAEGRDGDDTYAATHIDADSATPSHEYCAAITFEVWGLPEVLVAAARYHHHPEDAPEGQRTIAALVHLGDTLSNASGFGFALDSDPNGGSRDAACRTLGLDNQQIEEIGATLAERVEQLRRALAGD